MHGLINAPSTACWPPSSNGANKLFGLLKIVRIISKFPPFAWISRKSKDLCLPGFDGLPLYDVMVFFRKHIRKQAIAERASAIAYNFIMAMPPSLLFLFTLIPNLPFISKKSIRIQMHNLITDIIPSAEYNKQVIAFMDTFLDGSKIGLLSFGLLFALFFASSGMMGLMRSFNRDYVGFEKRKGLEMRLMAVRLTIVLFGLLLGYLILLIMQGAILEVLVNDTTLRTVIFYTRWIFIVLLVYTAIGFIYRQAPAVKKKWHFSSPGTILATILSLLASFIFSLFVNNFGSYNALYGSIGTIMMVMALVFINALVLLVGFELNVSIHSLKVAVDVKKREAERSLTAEKGTSA